MELQLTVYTIVFICMFIFGLFLTFKTKKVQSISLNFQKKILFLDKFWLGKKLLEKLRADNDNKGFVTILKINGIIFMFISLIALYSLSLKWSHVG